MTPPQRRALFVLWEHGPLTGENFAKQMWPFSPSWQNRRGQRNFELEGAATTFLRRLVKMGLVVEGWSACWELTDFGHTTLRRERILAGISNATE